MPPTVSFPGVFVEETTGGAHPIAGVDTSITAFIGRAWRGPTDEAIPIRSFGDFDRVFGGLWVESTLGYAVRDFYLNGGRDAIIVRLFHPQPGLNPPAPTNTPLSVGHFTLEASEKGSWGGNLRFALDADVADPDAAAIGTAASEVFNLTVREVDANGAALRTEQFRSLTVVESSRRVDTVLARESALVRWSGPWPPPSLPNIAAIHVAQRTLNMARAASPQKPAAIAAARAALDFIATDSISRAEATLAAAQKVLARAETAKVRVEGDIETARTAVNNKNAALALAKSTSDGGALDADDFIGVGKSAAKQGLYSLEGAKLFNVLCIPPYLPTGDADARLIGIAAAYCEKRRAMLLVDPPAAWTDIRGASAGVAALGTSSENAAVFFPRIRQPNPLRNNQIESFVPCGAVAGVFARTDMQRGVWKAPAGREATLVGVAGLSVPITADANSELNRLGVNCLRSFPAAGHVVFGARTLQGDDRLASTWKFIPVRRMALFIEESLDPGLRWATFEPNADPLWARIRSDVDSFLLTLFRAGAFQGSKPQEAYFVKCGHDTTTDADIDAGIVNVVVGFAPLKPAEFVILTLRLLVAQAGS